MKITQKLSNLISDFKKTDEYWIESAKLQFSVHLEKQRKSAGLNYKSIAERIGSSAAYVSKIFRGDGNLTIESMVKLARATGGHLDIQIRSDCIEASDWSNQWNGNKVDANVQTHLKSTAVIIDFPTSAANRDSFWKQAA
ncbi:helix-turn-helix domain-containing protein [Comamonas aquatica]|uniref:helix-turn-helix domain-containing protein n=1 Tax=Comamonas aquatica TaxID=225991 RepID=UPI001EF3979B|nr:helix-turn-helix transcriptional regulator [Comamonas aquatica]